MIIVNADDWGRSPAETNAAAECIRAGRITSVTAMVFMRDSERAAELAKGLNAGVGLHLNLSQTFTADAGQAMLSERHGRIVRFLTFNKFALLMYNPFLRSSFEYVYEAQIQEFCRLYGRPPSHIDGHHHKHLCTNMLVDRIIPEEERVRRNFHYVPGQKSRINRMYRRTVDRVLARRYRVTDYLFSLSETLESIHLESVFRLARTSTVELMTHPVSVRERAYLLGDDYLARLAGLETGTFAAL
jgi:predicted glycoside hydrolase/deacetylase ChbG (UPF0249 family)